MLPPELWLSRPRSTAEKDEKNEQGNQAAAHRIVTLWRLPRPFLDADGNGDKRD
jgi:hypothetical protein